MGKIKIAIQGELGAYSHIAVKNLYENAEIKTCSTFEDTFKQAYNDPTYKIVIPIENSFALLIPETTYVPLNPVPAVPAVLFELVTLRILT